MVSFFSLSIQKTSHVILCCLKIACPNASCNEGYWFAPLSTSGKTMSRKISIDFLLSGPLSVQAFYVLIDKSSKGFGLDVLFFPWIPFSLMNGNTNCFWVACWFDSVFSYYHSGKVFLFKKTSICSRFAICVLVLMRSKVKLSFPICPYLRYKEYLFIFMPLHERKKIFDFVLFRYPVSAWVKFNSSLVKTFFYFSWIL